MVYKLFTDPELFLQRQAATGRLIIPTAIVLMFSFVMSLQAAAVYYAAGDGASEVINGVILLGIYYFFQGVFLWIGFSFAFYLIAVALRGYPLLGHLFRVVAWGMIPALVAPVIWALGRYYALRGGTVPSPEREGSISSELDALREFTAQANGDPVLVGSILVSGIIFALSWYLWSVGLIRSGDLSRKRAAVTAAIPTVAVFVWYLTSAL